MCVNNCDCNVNVDLPCVIGCGQKETICMHSRLDHASETNWNLSCDHSACQLHIYCAFVRHLILPVTVSKKIVPMEARGYTVEADFHKDKEVPCLQGGEGRGRGDQLTQLCHFISQRLRQCDRPTLGLAAKRTHKGQTNLQDILNRSSSVWI